MNIASYWIANMITDMVKVLIPMVIILVMGTIADQLYEGAWVVSLVFILGLIPFTYFVCLVFNNDTLAQVLSLIIHLVVGAFLPDFVIFAQSFGETVVWADRLRWGLCLIPTFPLIHGLSISNPDTLKDLYDARMLMSEDVIAQDDLWDWWNLKGDIAILLLHFFFWSLIIGWFELDLCQCWSKLSCQKVPK